MGESNTIVSVSVQFIGTYNSIALTHRYVSAKPPPPEFKRPKRKKIHMNRAL